jgi:hypothetical protein
MVPLGWFRGDRCRPVGGCQAIVRTMPLEPRHRYGHQSAIRIVFFCWPDLLSGPGLVLSP